jgi:ribose transport system ATP-binding protein
MTVSNTTSPTPSPEHMLLRVEGLVKTFSGVVALNGVSFELKAGEVHVLLGENGAGKSTLIKCLSGAYHPDSGQIFMNGESVSFQGTSSALSLGIATIYQEFNLVPELTVAENVLLGRQPRRFGVVDKAASRRQALAALQAVGLEDVVDRKVSSLGVARQQLVEIAKALRHDVRVLILDEPTAALTDDEVDRLLGLMDELRGSGVGLIFISHHLSEIRRIGDRVTVLRDGATIKTVAASTSEDELVSLMVGRDIIDHYPRRSSPPGRPLLHVQNLSASGRFSDVNLQVHAGEVVGLAGIVGAGRTEVLRAVAGIDPYENGEVWMEGTALPRHRFAAAVSAGLGLVPEDRKQQGLVLSSSVAENLALVSLARITRRGVVDGRRIRRQALQSVADLRIRCSGIDQKVGNLSGGNQQKVVVGKWLNAGPKVMLLDEPTRGVDIGARVEIYELINRMTDEGRGVLLASSDLPEVLGMCDRILVMAAGRIVGELTRSEATQDRVMELAVKEVESTRVH